MLIIGQPAPLFTAEAVLNAGEFKNIALEDLRGQWVILFFYPFDFSRVCPTELEQLRKFLPKFKELNAEVLACSVDSIYAHKKWLAELGDLHFALLSDGSQKIARDYGVLVEPKGHASRGTFIIDPEGRIQYMTVHNTAVGRDANELLRVLAALKSGELCAAGWKQGQAFLTSP